MASHSTPTHIWEAGSGRRLSLSLTLDEAKSCSHAGRCDDDVAWLMAQPHIEAQTAQWDPAILAAELREYGAWESDELADHKVNVSRMVWMACCDVAEQPEVYVMDGADTEA